MEKVAFWVFLMKFKSQKRSKKAEFHAKSQNKNEIEYFISICVYNTPKIKKRTKKYLYFLLSKTQPSQLQLITNTEMTILMFF